MTQIRGSVSEGNNIQEVEDQKAARVAVYPPAVDAANGGRYRIGASTGLITTIAAHTASAGHIGAFRWGSTTKTCIVDNIRIVASMVTDFTTLQQFRIGARIARSYSASHTGGTQLTLTGNNGKLRTDYATTALTDFSISTTSALTAGTHTIDTQPFLLALSGQPSDGATVGNIPFEAVFDARESGPIVLEANEGIVFSNEILMGAAGTATVGIVVSWREYLNEAVPSGL